MNKQSFAASPNLLLRVGAERAGSGDFQPVQCAFSRQRPARILFHQVRRNLPPEYGRGL